MTTQVGSTGPRSTEVVVKKRERQIFADKLELELESPVYKRDTKSATSRPGGFSRVRRYGRGDIFRVRRGHQ